MISTEFLSSVAEHIDGQIAKIVLNGSHEITNFDLKEIDGGLVSMKYSVLNGAVATVTLIEIKDSTNNLISSNPVYIPITADTLIKHTLEVKEG